jgi:chitinase
MTNTLKRTFLLFLLGLLPLFSIANASARPLLTAFYYPGNRKINDLDMVLNQTALRHLDILIYSPSIHGLQPMDGTYRMNHIARYNLSFMARYFHKHNYKLKLMLSLGYWGPRFMRHVITMPSTQRRFITAVINTLKNKSYNLKGIDIDWENEYSPIRNERKRFPIFVKQLKEAMVRNGLSRDYLTVDLPSNHIPDFPKPRTWLRYVNWANLMAYDFYGDILTYTELDSTLGYVTTPYPDKPPSYDNVSLAAVLTTYQQLGIPKNRMVVILPLYGAMMHVKHTSGLYYNGLRQPITSGPTPAYIPYWKIYLTYGNYNHPLNGYIPHEYTFTTPSSTRNDNSFWMTKGTRFLSYPDPIAIKQDADYIVGQHYLGMSVWELSDALKFENSSSLLAIIARAEGR